MDIVYNISENVFLLLIEMSPYLLLGFTIAGLLSVLFSSDQIQNKIGSNNFISCFKAVIFGIPLPLCSCGVIPVGASLRRYGASRGATISFITTTPQTGVDSIILTYGMLGLPLLILKLIVALTSGLVAGILTNTLAPSSPVAQAEPSGGCCDNKKESLLRKGLTYGFRTLPKDIAEPLLVGLLLAGIIGLLAQDNFIHLTENIKNYSSFMKIFIIMLVSIPLYICATASIPIALMIASLFGSPGAAVALLIAGPATNFSTITTCIKIVGKRSTAVYVLTVFSFALLSGIITDSISISIPNYDPSILHEHTSIFSYFCIAALLMILTNAVLYNKKLETSDSSTTMSVRGMTCSHCESSVIKSLLSVKGISEVQASHQNEEVVITGKNININEVKKIIQSLNYEVN